MLLVSETQLSRFDSWLVRKKCCIYMLRLIRLYRFDWFLPLLIDDFLLLFFHAFFNPLPPYHVRTICLLLVRMYLQDPHIAKGWNLFGFAEFFVLSYLWEAKIKMSTLVRSALIKLTPLVLSAFSFSTAPTITSALLRRASPVCQAKFRYSNSPVLSMSSSDVIPGRPTWQQTMLRINLSNSMYTNKILISHQI